MQRVDSKDNVPALPALTEAGNSPGYFSDGDQANEIPGTVVPAWWLNMVQEEICAVIEVAGVALQKNVRNQLLTAIKKILEDSNFAKMAKEAKDAAATAGTTAGTAAEQAALAKSIADALKILVDQSQVDVDLALSAAETAKGDAQSLLTYQE
ncbi:MAG: hypothetical protein LBP92_06365, partial [Deltaproteobacteria bacterium]|nr:hypothetical protein [Deltaproteobacteria bacterium]